jgi:ketosteroid isomerase-like protein
VTQKNIEVVRAVVDGWVRGDSSTLDLLAPEVEYVSEVPLLSGHWRGHEGVLRWFVDFRREWSDYEVRIELAEDLGDEVLTVESHRATGKRSGVGLEMRTASLWKVRDGVVIRWRGFRDEDEAREFLKQRS